MNVEVNSSIELSALSEGGGSLADSFAMIIYNRPARSIYLRTAEYNLAAFGVSIGALGLPSLEA